MNVLSELAIQVFVIEFNHAIPKIEKEIYVIKNIPANKYSRNNFPFVLERKIE